jgi:hypothetical protein
MKIDVRVLTGIAVVIAIAAFVYWYWNSPERQIKKLLSKAEAAFEAKDIEGTIDHFSLQYRDDLGLAYLNIKQLMKRGYEEFEGFDVKLGNLDIEVGDDQATVFSDFRLIVINDQKAYLIGSDEEVLPITFEFAKETMRWKIRAVNGIRVPYMEF